jgi:chromosomal replication initiation ATPase DnaA
MNGPAKAVRRALLAAREGAAWERWGWLVESAAARHGVEVDDLLGPRRTAILAAARADLCTNLWGSGLPYSEIGRLVGRDHTTVLYLVRKELTA